MMFLMGFKTVGRSEFVFRLWLVAGLVGSAACGSGAARMDSVGDQQGSVPPIAVTDDMLPAPMDLAMDQAPPGHAVDWGRALVDSTFSRFPDPSTSIGKWEYSRALFL